jgi:hypothetical protein
MLLLFDYSTSMYLRESKKEMQLNALIISKIQQQILW